MTAPKLCWCTHLLTCGEGIRIIQQKTGSIISESIIANFKSGDYNVANLAQYSAYNPSFQDLCASLNFDPPPSPRLFHLHFQHPHLPLLNLPHDLLFPTKNFIRQHSMILHFQGKLRCSSWRIHNMVPPLKWWGRVGRQVWR